MSHGGILQKPGLANLLRYRYLIGAADFDNDAPLVLARPAVPVIQAAASFGRGGRPSDHKASRGSSEAPRATPREPARRSG